MPPRRPAVPVRGEENSLRMHTALKDPELNHHFFSGVSYPRYMVLSYLRHRFEE